MLYAKINESGEVTQFPYRFNDIDTTAPVPEDAVQVDTETNKPDHNWDQILHYGDITIVDGSYTLNYTVHDRFVNDEDAKKNLQVRIKQVTDSAKKKLDSFVSSLEQEYPSSETKSWDQQVREAQAYIIDDQSSVPLLTKLASTRGITITQLANRIIEKATVYAENYGQALGEYQRVVDVVESIDLEDKTTWNNFNQVL